MANVTYTVPNKNGSYDGDMVVKQYSSMTINNGDTITTDQPCRGLMILVQGNCTINGTLSMTGRGAYANPTSNGGSDSNSVDANGLRMPFVTSGGSSSLSASNTLFNGCGNDARSVLGNFKTKTFDYTRISILPFYKFKNGESMFKFDQIYDKFTLDIGFDQQLYGPIILKSNGTLNLDSDSNDYGEFINSKISLNWKKRSYEFGIFYQPHDQAGGISFNLFGFK